MMILKEFSRIVCVSLFSYQGSLFVCLATAHLVYHSHFCLSRTFLSFFQNFLMTFVIRCLSATRLLYHIHFWMSSTFLKFFIFSKFKTSNGEGGIWTLAPVTRPIPLAGAPLRPLEYFSWLRIHNTLCNLKCISFRNAWLIIHNWFYIVNTFFAFILIFFYTVFTCLPEAVF